ncbi:MAG: 2-C-methyl-D-erythritol 4-phosphate cytidylyltransferase [Nitrospirales bacterium]|nr:2-C-methyl-D-erythritol 4-phosphate cytidylyltransferase [Nitrospirales bacterium]
MKGSVHNRVAAVIPAAGLGRRFGSRGGKTLHLLSGKPLLAWVLEAFQHCRLVDEILPVLKAEDREAGWELVEHYGITKVRRIAPGGSERQDSVFNGLEALGGEPSLVVIHDGARPLVESFLIERAIEGLKGYDGAVAGVPVKDTIKAAKHSTPACDVAGQNGRAPDAVVEGTLDRTTLWAIQTPQAFPLERIREAHRRARSEGFYATDDAALVERYGGAVRIVMGSYRNMKMTTPEDILVAEALLKGMP